MLWNRHRQTSGWIDIAEQNVGYRMAALLTRIPCFHNGVRMLIDPWLGNRTTVNIYNYKLFSQLADFLHQFKLYAGQTQ
ncbi:hypothetical protein D3C80_1385380 [compost metagenome]